MRRLGPSLTQPGSESSLGLTYHDTKVDMPQPHTPCLVVPAKATSGNSRTSQALVQADVVLIARTARTATPTIPVRVRPPHGAQHLAGKLKATPFARQLSLILARPNVLRNMHPMAAISILSRRISSRFMELNSRLSSTFQLNFRYPGRRLSNRQADLAVRTEILWSVKSMTVALHDQRSSKDKDGRSNTTMPPTAVHFAIAMSSQSVIALCLARQDTAPTAKNLKFPRDSNANMSRGKNSAVSHHKSDDKILMTANDTLGGHVDATKTPTLGPTSLSTVPAVVDTTEEGNYTPRLCKHLELLSRSEYNSAFHDQPTTFPLLDTHTSPFDASMYTNATI
jgi:hypothetical protein